MVELPAFERLENEVDIEEELEPPHAVIKFKGMPFDRLVAARQKSLTIGIPRTHSSIVKHAVDEKLKESNARPKEQDIILRHDEWDDACVSSDETSAEHGSDLENEVDALEMLTVYRMKNEFPCSLMPSESK